MVLAYLTSNATYLMFVSIVAMTCHPQPLQDSVCRYFDSTALLRKQKSAGKRLVLIDMKGYRSNNMQQAPSVVDKEEAKRAAHI